MTGTSLSGGAGTANVNGTLYARQGAALTLTVTTDGNTKCVRVTDGTTTIDRDATSAKTSWTFTTTDSSALFTTGSGDGVKTLTATAFRNSNGQHKCTANQGEQFGTQTASYVLDNTAPVVAGTLAPAPNAAGWNRSNVTVTWSATDAGSGVTSGPTPAGDSQTSDTTSSGVVKTATATDAVGNTGSGSVAVKLDETAPTITGSRTPAANANGWNNTDVTASFSCSDSLSGIKSCSGPTTFSSSAADQSVAGTAVDNADNSSGATVSGIDIDKVAPTLSGAPTTSPNGDNGWYTSNVAIHWTASDSLSGLDGSAPSDSTISGEGQGLTATASISDMAGNTTTGTSSPAVKIDKTPPNTTVTAPANWNNTNVTVTLNASDALSGVAATHYTVDGGAEQQYLGGISVSSDGDHVLTFWSTDVAGNAELAKTVHVLIDKTPPTIGHTQSPLANGNGWNNTSVTVTFVCGDSLSGIASCTAPQTVPTEGKDQVVTGTATDNAGNTATDPATVSIDETAPTITAAADRAANGNGWYNADVTVGFTCGDALSGIDLCPSAVALGEGAAQVGSGTASDAAGNTASASVTGIDVDKTPPALSGETTTSPNGNGWYGGDVTVHWTASDALSGLDGPAPADSTITGEGDNLSAGASISDLAGNSTSTTVDGIKIDRTAPVTTAGVPAPLPSGWYAGPVLVTLNAVDGLSGVDTTYYAIDGGPQHVYDGPFSEALGGSHTVTFWSADRAGNVEDNTGSAQTITLKIDDVPPTIDGNRTPDANAFGWNNVPVSVGFFCSDLQSGIASCTPVTVLSNEGAGQSYTGTAQDNAGNTASAKVEDVNIDLTAPTLTGATTTSPNAYGWYKGDVTIHWTGQDGLSGIDPATQPPDSVITGEGSNLGVGPVSISDKAGNLGSGSVSGIKIDRTAPSIGGATVNDDGTLRAANGAGWFNSAVRVRFACGDALSGVQDCGSDVVLNTDGAGQSAQGTATDRADNSASTTVSGINIDSQPPQTSADLQCTSKNGFCKGNSATVNLTAVDQAGLSGIKEIHYQVDSGGWQIASGASKSVNVPLAAKSGTASVSFYAVDNAGNAETQSGVSLKYDNIAPTVTHAVSPAPNAAHWNNSDATVHFDATDDVGGSGVDAATVTPDQTVSTETAGTTVNGQGSDLAGNVGYDSVVIKLDKTVPTIAGAATTSPNANGWYSGPVTVHFTCADQGAVQSGVATCPNDTTLSNDGANQSVSGTAVDNAGNSSTQATVGGIAIDTVKPTVTVNGVADGGIYTLGAVPAVSCTATDTLSGLDGGCSVSVSGGTPNGVGTYTFAATATDRAGNTRTTTGSYKVSYRWDGFSQPINDTAHYVGLTTSVFKAGSTVPAKFQLKDASGNVVQASSLPLWITPKKGAAMTTTVDETVYNDPATSGASYRWDPTAQQYVYNWGTAKNQAGYFWGIGVQFDDGNTYWVSIGLR